MAVYAPEIDRPGLTWFNTREPLGMARLRGRLVLLDFWTFCCINCQHVLPVLARLEAHFGDHLVVIGVHSPKFAAERDPANVAQAIARHDIRHPVVHDPDFTIWKDYAVRAWPTLVFISPQGEVMGQYAGEPDPERLLMGVGEMLRGVTAPAQSLPLVAPPEVGGTLRFPGKIKRLAAPVDGALWALADAGHHRVVLLDDDGDVVRTIGSGVAGFADGPADTAAFREPQGLGVGSDWLAVADTGNHALRRIDLVSGTVTTLAGHGGRGLPLQTVLEAPLAGLASPWDAEIDGGRVYVANAGTHQLGVLDLGAGTLGPLAGSGYEGLRDGPAAEAHLAQPSGLALGGDGALYFADSETSAIRRLWLAEDRVETLAGSGLFDFGHVNGPLADAQFQHCLGLAWLPGQILVADSYNGVARRIDLDAGTAGDIGPLTCLDPQCRPATGEPAGIAADGPDRLLLVETNHHRVVEIRPADGTSRTWCGDNGAAQ